MLTLSEAIAKVVDPRVRVSEMRPFAEDEVEGGLAFIANKLLSDLQAVHEARRRSDDALVRARQYLYDTYGYDEAGAYVIPCENVEDLALAESVRVRLAEVARSEVDGF